MELDFDQLFARLFFAFAAWGAIAIFHLTSREYAKIEVKKHAGSQSSFLKIRLVIQTALVVAVIAALLCSSVMGEKNGNTWAAFLFLLFFVPSLIGLRAGLNTPVEDEKRAITSDSL